jgi:hypothetical protein
LVGAVGRPASAVGHGILGQGDDVKDAGFDVFASALGEWNLRGFALAGHRNLEGIILSLAPLKVSIKLGDIMGYSGRGAIREIGGPAHRVAYLRQQV